MWHISVDGSRLGRKQEQGLGGLEYMGAGLLVRVL